MRNTMIAISPHNSLQDDSNEDNDDNSLNTIGLLRDSGTKGNGLSKSFRTPESKMPNSRLLPCLRLSAASSHQRFRHAEFLLNLLYLVLTKSAKSTIALCARGGRF